MKKSLNIAGIIFLSLILLGIIFKSMHYPGASIMITLGMFLFVTIYLTGFLISIYKSGISENSLKSKFLLFLGFPGIAILSFGILAKIMHWPGASIGLWLGIGLLSLIFLVFLLFGKKEDQKISITSVLIVVVLLGSFSFNIFRIGYIRPMTEAYSFNRSSFSESSKIFWETCESRISSLANYDSTKINSTERNELLKIHLKVQETDLILGKMIEKATIAESEAVSMTKPAEKNNYITDRVQAAFNSEDGLALFDQKMIELRSLINNLTNLDNSKKQNYILELQYPFSYEGSELVHIYTGISDYNPDVSICSLQLWKSKIWQIEYQLICDVTKSL